MEQSELAEAPRSVVLDLLRRSHLHQNLAVVLGPVGPPLDRVTRPFSLAEYPATSPVRRKTEDLVFWVIVGGLLAWGAVARLTYLRRSIGFGAFGACIGLDAITFARVIVVVVVSALVWVPIGATIGMSPRLARVVQPVVQILASFPANLLFPFLILIFIAIHLPLNVGSIVLMAVGAQWYILFTATADAMNDDGVLADTLVLLVETGQ